MIVRGSERVATRNAVRRPILDRMAPYIGTWRGALCGIVASSDFVVNEIGQVLLCVRMALRRWPTISLRN